MSIITMYIGPFGCSHKLDGQLLDSHKPQWTRNDADIQSCRFPCLHLLEKQEKQEKPEKHCLRQRHNAWD